MGFGLSGKKGRGKPALEQGRVGRYGKEIEQASVGKKKNGHGGKAGLRAETEEGERSLFSVSNIPKQFPNTNSKQFEV